MVRHRIGRGAYLFRSQVMLMMTYKFLRWMHSAGRMDEGVVASENCWNGIEEKMPEISRETNHLNRLRSGHVSTFSRIKFANLIRRF